MKTIYKNGKIYTGELPLRESFAVEDGHYLFAGSNADADLLADADTKVVDLGGKFVMSAFDDSHMHLLNYGQSLRAAKLAEHTKSLGEMIAYLGDFLREHPVREGGWLIGRGWNQDYFTDTDRMPDRRDLDQVSTEIPIVCIRTCGHCLAANSKAIELAGVTKDTEAPEGGRIGITDGELDGRFYDNGMNLIYDRIKAPDKEDLKDMIRLAMKELNRYGVTSSQTDDYCVFRNVPWQTVMEAYRELEDAGEMTVRVYEQSNFTSLADLKAFVEAGNVTGTGTEFFRTGPLKMLGDGALGGRTAYLSRPYHDDPSTKGFPLFTQEEFDSMISYANAHGMQIAVHCIGDACLDMVLSAYEKALREHPVKDHRHGIVHCQVTRPEQLDKIAELGLHVYMQSIFLDYDIHMVESRLGKDLADTSYRWKTLMKKGVSVSNGTDCPVELPDALACMQCAVTRKTLHDNLGPYLADERFTVKEALDSYTIRSAEASFDENRKGQIKPGFIADFVVLGEDPFTADPETIKDIPVLQTFVGGKEVYHKN